MMSKFENSASCFSISTSLPTLAVWNLLRPRISYQNSSPEIGHVYSFSSCIRSPSRNGHSRRSDKSSRLEWKARSFSFRKNGITHLGRIREAADRERKLLFCVFRQKQQLAREHESRMRNKSRRYAWPNFLRKQRRVHVFVSVTWCFPSETWAWQESTTHFETQMYPV